MEFFSNFHDYHVGLKGLNYISQYSLRHLLLHYITKDRNILGIQHDDNDNRKFSKLFKYLHRASMEKHKKMLLKQLDARVLPRIYTDNTKSAVKDDVEYEAFDISTMEKILACTPIFPYCRYKTIKCNSQNHLGKCCKDCEKKHYCTDCGKEICENGCCLSNYFRCEHPCQCGGLRSECKDYSLVCCSTCNKCYYCQTQVCFNHRISEAIKVFLKIRHLVSHATEYQPWQQLREGNFDSEDFRDIATWQDFCNYVYVHYHTILKFLKSHCIIKGSEYDDFEFYTKTLADFNKNKIVNLRLFSHVTQMHRDEHVLQTPSTAQFSLDVLLKINRTVPKKMQGICGELSEIMCEGIREAAIRETQGNSTNIIVNPDVCDCSNRLWKRSKVNITATLQPTTVEKERELRAYYDNKFSENSKTFFRCIENNCEKSLAEKNIIGDVVVKGFKLGSFHLKLVISSTTNNWIETEMDSVVIPTLRGCLENTMDGGLEVKVFQQDDSVAPSEVLSTVCTFNVELIDGSTEVDTSWLAMEARRLANNKMLEEGNNQRYVTFIGQAGVGKSLLLNRLLDFESTNCVFRSDEHLVHTLTSVIQQKEHKDVIFTDTPGYNSEQQTTRKAVNRVLAQGGQHKIFFVVTLESGRVRRSDVTMVKDILQLTPDITDYGIVITKLSQNLFKILSSNGHYRSQILQMFPTSDNDRNASLLLMPDEHSTTVRDRLQDFVNNVPFVPISEKSYDQTSIMSVGMMKKEIDNVKEDIFQMQQEIMDLIEDVETRFGVTKLKETKVLKELLNSLKERLKLSDETEDSIGRVTRENSYSSIASKSTNGSSTMLRQDSVSSYTSNYTSTATDDGEGAANRSRRKKIRRRKKTKKNQGKIFVQ